MGVSELQYEPHAKGRPVVVERDDAVTRIVVAMRGPYAPVPKWACQLDALSVIIAPTWWIGALIVRTCLRLPKPPRVIFEVTGDRLKVHLRDRGTGEVTTFDWPRSAVAEARANRYDKGFWLNVPGHVKETYLTDLPRDSIERLEVALRSVLNNETVAAD
jgi:hypothetical protein